MTVIRVLCADCREPSDLRADDILLLSDSYVFMCDRCDGFEQKPTDRQIELLLRAAGVK